MSEPECPGPDCMSCSGEACQLCGAGCWNNAGCGHDCEHDVIDRHNYDPNWRCLRCQAGEPPDRPV